MPRRPVSPSPTRSSSRPGLRSRGRRLLAGAGAVGVLTIAALLAAAIIPGAHASGTSSGRARHSVVSARPGNRAHVLESTVVGSGISARRYAALATAIENGINAQGEYVSDLTPISWQSVQGPIAHYKRYAERWATRLQRSMRPLGAALRADDRGAAQRDWVTSFDDYLQLGAVYGLLPTSLNDALAEVPPSDGDTRFPGLHRIERGLWTGESPRSLVPIAAAIARATVTLRRTIPGMWVSSFAYTLRAHEIMEDAQRDLMSGLVVPWSQAGVSATAASLAAEREVVATLVPLLQGRDDTLGVAQYWFTRLARAFADVRRPDGSYPTLGELTGTQRELLDGTLAGTCTALSAVPDTLELHPVPTIPPDPDNR